MGQGGRREVSQEATVAALEREGGALRCLGGRQE